MATKGKGIKITNENANEEIAEDDSQKESECAMDTGMEDTEVGNKKITLEGMKANAEFIIKASHGTVTIQPFKPVDVKCDEFVYVINKAKSATLHFDDRTGQLSLQFRPYRTWFVEQIVTGINRLLARHSELTIECSDEFKDLLSRTKSRKLTDSMQNELSPYCLYINHLPKGTTDDQLKEVFPNCIKVAIPKDPEGEVMGWALVQFETKEEPDKCLDKETPYMLNDVKLYVNMVINECHGRASGSQKKKAKRQKTPKWETLEKDGEKKKSNTSDGAELKRKSQGQQANKEQKKMKMSGGFDSSKRNNTKFQRPYGGNQQMSNMGSYGFNRNRDNMGMGMMNSSMGRMNMGGMNNQSLMGMPNNNRMGPDFMGGGGMGGRRDQDYGRDLSRQIQAVRNSRDGSGENMVAMLETALETAKSRMRVDFDGPMNRGRMSGMDGYGYDRNYRSGYM